jgi:hypothetical protein
MKIGTRSVIYGAHQFVLHPLFVALAWWKLYSFPFDPRLWVAFFVHDLGYIGKPNLDGPEGESHVELGAAIMGVFGSKWADSAATTPVSMRDGTKPRFLASVWPTSTLSA